MSNPLNSLNRYPKRPFRESNLNKINEKLSDITTNLDESNQNFDTPVLDLELKELLDDVTTDMAKKNLSKYSREMLKLELLPSGGCFSSRSSDSSTCKPLIEDYEIISKLMNRIKQMELAQRFQEKEIKEKNLRIKVLEDKCKLYQKSKEINNMNYDKVTELEKICEKLQTQVSEMENFLADYGLMWVGEDSVVDDGELGQNDTWNIEESPATFLEDPTNERFVIDYDKVLLNIEELNRLVKSEESQVTMTGPHRVELKKKECIRLTLYANGIFLFNGPFRSFANKSTRDVVQDIIDGYFPSELEDRYPSGVPFEVIDRRNIYFDVKEINTFQGAGKILGGESTSSKLVNQSTVNTRDDNRYTQPYTDVLFKDPTTQITMEQFLRKLPTSTINKNGKIISIRNSIQEIIENKPMKSVRQTSIESDSTKLPTSSLDNKSENPVSLKIRSINGEHVYRFFMKPTQTVGDIYQKISEITNMNVSEFVLISAFPLNDKLVDMGISLESCGLAPNSSLYMKRSVTK